MSAYDENYIEDSTELNCLVFEEIARCQDVNFEHFVEGYMSSGYRKLMDKGSTRLINMTFDEYLTYLRRDCPELFIIGNKEHEMDVLQAGWIGAMYNRLQFHLCISSEKIYERLNLRTMMSYFITLHTIDETLALRRIMDQMN